MRSPNLMTMPKYFTGRVTKISVLSQMFVFLTALTRLLSAFLREPVASFIYVRYWFTERLYPVLARDGGVSDISYVLVWRNTNAETDRVDHYYAPYPGHPAEEDFLRFSRKTDILFEDDLPNLYVFPKP